VLTIAVYPFILGYLGFEQVGEIGKATITTDFMDISSLFSKNLLVKKMVFILWALVAFTHRQG